VNAIFRVVDGLAARFAPRRADQERAATQLVTERAAMDEFRSASPFAAPTTRLIAAG
jgi:hypothetical protein